MRRTVLGLYTYFEFFLLAVLFVPVLGTVAVLFRREPGRRTRGRWMRRFGRLTSSLTPIWRFESDGPTPEKIMERPYVVVSNHESTADPFLLSWLPWDMRWVAKEELFKLPLIGWLLRFGGDMPVRRGDKGSVEELMKACKETLAAGVPVMLFPEGTRSPDGKLLPFKDGAFQLAIETGVPIVPVALSGTRSCRPKGSLWFGEARARVRALAPISTEGLTLADVATLRERVRAVIEQAVQELRQELHPPV
ncbi:MAG: lysophospholipid acyltransferase family protein [Myxococcota bacterium]